MYLFLTCPDIFKELQGLNPSDKTTIYIYLGLLLHDVTSKQPFLNVSVIIINYLLRRTLFSTPIVLLSKHIPLKHNPASSFSQI